MEKRTKAVLIAAAVLMILGAGTPVFAQSAGNPWGQVVTVEGTLQLQNGTIALASGDTTYFVPRLFRYVGFIDSLKEGARVSVEGYVDGRDTLMPTAFTVNGKSYDLSANMPGGGYGMRYRDDNYGMRYHGYQGCGYGRGFDRGHQSGWGHGRYR